MAKFTSGQEVLDFIESEGIRIIDIKFTDLLGTFQHFSLTNQEFDMGSFENGLGFDGSSIRGFQDINESDMLLFPDPSTVYVEPFFEEETLSISADIRDPVTRDRYSRDPRYVATKAEEFLKSSGIADTSFWGPELEFFIFDGMSFDQNAHSSHHFIESDEGIWHSGRDAGIFSTGDSEYPPNLAYRPRHKSGYFPTPPIDTQQDIRSEIVTTLMDLGVRMEVHHHEVATAGQGEIDLKYGPLRDQADTVMLAKHVMRNVAYRNDKVLTFMPKPIYGDNGTGMHVHQSLWKDGVNLFYDEQGYALISEMCRHYIGGLLKHAGAILAFAAPTTNSYKRLVPGYEAPVNLAYSQRNRSACVRIPVAATGAAARRLEFRPPDATANPYLAFPAMLMAGLDGIINKIDPGDPLDVDIYHLPPEELAKVKTVPHSLDEALIALEEDHEFLLRGDVFTTDLIETWVAYKRENEIDELRLRPHPYEFFMYSDY